MDFNVEMIGNKTVLVLKYEPRHEKTCLRDLQPAKTQTGLLTYTD